MAVITVLNQKGGVGKSTTTFHLGGALAKAGRRVLLVDNLVISGETMRRFDGAVSQLGADVVGHATLWNSAGPQIAGHDVYGLLNTVYATYVPPDCPHCAAGEPLIAVGY